MRGLSTSVLAFSFLLGGCGAGVNDVSIVPTGTLTDCRSSGRYSESFSVQAKSVVWQQQRVIIDLAFTNVGRQPASLAGMSTAGNILPGFQLVNNEGIKYNGETDAALQGGSPLTAFGGTRLNPGITSNLKLQFQVPNGGTYALEIVQTTFADGQITPRTVYRCSLPSA